MTWVDLLDGGFYLGLDEFDEAGLVDGDQPPGHAAVTRDALFIVSHSTWQRADVVLYESTGPTPLDPAEWSAVVEYHLELGHAGRLALRTMEFDAVPGRDSAVEVEAERYGVQLASRSAEFATRLGVQLEDDPVDQYLIAVYRERGQPL